MRLVDNCPACDEIWRRTLRRRREREEAEAEAAKPKAKPKKKARKLKLDADGFVRASIWAENRGVYMSQVSSWVKRGLPSEEREIKVRGKVRMVRFVNVEEADAWREQNTRKKTKSSEDKIWQAENHLQRIEALSTRRPDRLGMPNKYCPGCTFGDELLVEMTFVTAFEKGDESDNHKVARCATIGCSVHYTAPMRVEEAEAALRGEPLTLAGFKFDEPQGVYRRAMVVGRE